MKEIQGIHCARKSMLRQFLSSSMVLMTSFIYGCKVGFVQAVTPMFLSTEAPFQVTTADISWMGSIAYTGTIISVIICYSLSSKVGRRTFIFCCTLTFTLSWLLILTTSSIRVIIFCFFLYGVAASMLVIIGNIYFSEMASPKNREILGNLYFVATNIGTEVTYFLSVFDSYRLMAAFPFVICLLTLSLLIYMKESPCYLLSQGSKEEAERNYRWLQNKSVTENIDEDMSNMQKFVSEHERYDLSKLKTILMPENLKLLGILLVINSLPMMNTSTILHSYGPLLIDNLTYAVNAKVFLNIFNIFALVTQILAIVTTKMMERRPQIMYGFFAAGIIQVIIALLYYIHAKTEPGGNSTIAFFIAFMLIVNLVEVILTCQAGMCILKPEILPHRLKEFYTSVFAFASDCFAFVTVKTFFSLYSAMNIYYLILLYSSPCFISAVLFYIFIPNTKNKTLYQIRSEIGTAGQN